MCILQTIQLHNTHISQKTNFSPTLPIVPLRSNTLIMISPFYEIHKNISNLAAWLLDAQVRQLNNCIFSLLTDSLIIKLFRLLFS